MTTQLLQAIPTVTPCSCTLHATKQDSKQVVSALTRDQLIETIANILEDMIAERCNNYASFDDIPAPNMFHAKKLPSISIKDYLKRFAQFSECQDYIFVIVLIFLDRLGEKVEDFGLDSFNALR